MPNKKVQLNRTNSLQRSVRSEISKSSTISEPSKKSTDGNADFKFSITRRDETVDTKTILNRGKEKTESTAFQSDRKTYHDRKTPIFEYNKKSSTNWFNQIKSDRNTEKYLNSLFENKSYQDGCDELIKSASSLSPENKKELFNYIINARRTDLLKLFITEKIILPGDHVSLNTMEEDCFFLVALHLMSLDVTKWNDVVELMLQFREDTDFYLTPDISEKALKIIEDNQKKLETTKKSNIRIHDLNTKTLKESLKRIKLVLEKQKSFTQDSKIQSDLIKSINNLSKKTLLSNKNHIKKMFSDDWEYKTARFGNTILSTAIEKLDFDSFKKIADSIPDHFFKNPDKNKNTVLYYAIMKDQKKFLSYVANRGGVVSGFSNTSNMGLAIKNKKVNSLEFLIEHYDDTGQRYKNTGKGERKFFKELSRLPKKNFLSFKNFLENTGNKIKELFTGKLTSLSLLNKYISSSRDAVQPIKDKRLDSDPIDENSLPREPNDLRKLADVNKHRPASSDALQAFVPKRFESYAIDEDSLFQDSNDLSEWVNLDKHMLASSDDLQMFDDKTFDRYSIDKYPFSLLPNDLPELADYVIVEKDEERIYMRDADLPPDTTNTDGDLDSALDMEEYARTQFDSISSNNSSIVYDNYELDEDPSSTIDMEKYARTKFDSVDKHTSHLKKETSRVTDVEKYDKSRVFNGAEGSSLQGDLKKDQVVISKKRNKTISPEPGIKKQVSFEGSTQSSSSLEDRSTSFKDSTASKKTEVAPRKWREKHGGKGLARLDDSSWRPITKDIELDTFSRDRKDIDQKDK